MRTTLLISTLSAMLLGGVAHADRTTDAKRLIGETTAARDALARGQKHVAKRLIKDALALDAKLLQHDRVAWIGQGKTLDLVRAQRDLLTARDALHDGRVAEAESVLDNAVGPRQVQARRVRR